MSEKYKFEGVMTYGQMFNDLLPTIQEADVSEYLEACIQYTMDAGNMDRDEAENAVRINIGYIAGYFSTTEAARIHKLFNVVHPYLGSAENWGRLSAESIVEKGMQVAAELAPAAAEPTADGGGVDDAYVAEGLSAQIVHAQMVLQDALGYKENDYNVSLTDLVEDIEKLQAQRDAAVELLTAIERKMPDHDPSNERTTLASYAWSAWTAGQLIRAYQKQASEQK